MIRILAQLAQLLSEILENVMVDIAPLSSSSIAKSRLAR